jgi:pimeloyl-ACP methyl ester carboxylesterase
MKRQNNDSNKAAETAVQEHPVLIIGAGHNGLAVAYELKKIGLAPVILDAAGQPAAAWRGRHDQLRLNTHRLISYLPGMRIPRRYGAFPSRDDMVQYLEAYERFLDVAIHRQVRVERINRQSTGWRLTTSKGIWQTRNLTITTGNEHTPLIPDWPGRNEFTGELIHAALNAAPQDETIKLFLTIRFERIVPPLAEKTTSPKTRYAKSSKTYIAYQHLGKGPVDILFVSGFVSHIEYLWRETGLAAFFHRMARSARLILFDKRGVGLSDRNGDPPNLDNTLEDIQAVLKASGSKGAVLIGASEGGPAIIKYAEAFPQHCKGLVLYGTMAKGTRSEDYPFAWSREQYDKWMARLIGSWGGPVGIDSFAPSRKNDAPFRQWWATLLRLSSSPGNVRLVLEAMRDIDVRQLLPRIKVPTLIFHRKNDRAIPIAAGMYLASIYPGVTSLNSMARIIGGGWAIPSP